MATKKSHPAQIAPLAAAVRWTFTKLGRPVPSVAEAALALVERWLGGEAVTAAQFDAARAAAHEDGVPYVKRQKDRALMWANSAAGNLAWMATKARGWSQAAGGVLDSASYALSSDGIDVPRRQLDKIAAAAPPPGKAPPVTVKKTPRLKDELTPFIGAKASAKLKRCRARWDPEQRGSEAQLREALREHRLAFHRAVLTFESRYGGLLVPDDDTEDWLFGAYACLKSNAHVVSGKLIPVVYSPNDNIWFLDAKGAAWAQDTIEDPRPVRWAADGDEMVTRIIQDL